MKLDDKFERENQTGSLFSRHVYPVTDNAPDRTEWFEVELCDQTSPLSWCLGGQSSVTYRCHPC